MLWDIGMELCVIYKLFSLSKTLWAHASQFKEFIDKNIRRKNPLIMGLCTNETGLCRNLSWSIIGRLIGQNHLGEANMKALSPDQLVAKVEDMYDVGAPEYFIHIIIKWAFLSLNWPIFDAFISEHKYAIAGMKGSRLKARLYGLDENKLIWLFNKLITKRPVPYKTGFLHYMIQYTIDTNNFTLYNNFTFTLGPALSLEAAFEYCFASGQVDFLCQTMGNHIVNIFTLMGKINSGPVGLRRNILNEPRLVNLINSNTSMFKYPTGHVIDSWINSPRQSYEDEMHFLSKINVYVCKSETLKVLRWVPSRCLAAIRHFNYKFTKSEVKCALADFETVTGMAWPNRLDGVENIKALLRENKDVMVDGSH